MAYEGARVEAGRPTRMLLQTSRQEMMDDGDLDQGGGSGGGKKWSGSRYILKIELIGFSDGA